MPTDQPLLIGLTGGIGSGKSTVSEVLGKLGAWIIDADVIAHQLTAIGGAAMEEIVRAFGGDMIDDTGAMNRERMRELVFRDPVAKLKLESIVHPLVRATIGNLLADFARRYTFRQASEEETGNLAPYAVLVVPLLFESSSYRSLVHRIVVVDCAETMQIQRVIGRSGLAVEAVQRIIATQVPRAVRLQLADDVLSNTGTKAALSEVTKQLHNGYLSFLAAMKSQVP